MNNKPKYNPNKHHRRSIRLKGYDYSQAGLYFITICCQHRIWRFGEVINGEMLLNEFGEIAYNEWIKLTERFPNFELDVFQIMPNHMHGIIVLKDVGATLAVAQNDLDSQNDSVSQNLNGAGASPARTVLEISNVENDCIIEKGTVVATLAVDRNDSVSQNDSVSKNLNGAGASPARTVLEISDVENDCIIEKSIVGATLAVAQNDLDAPNDSNSSVSDMVGAYKSLVANACLSIYKSNNEIMGKLWQRNYYEHIIRNEQSYINISNYIINNPSKFKEDKFYKK
jgi:REP element-mobilizing transposase RayT